MGRKSALPRFGYKRALAEMLTKGLLAASLCGTTAIAQNGPDRAELQRRVAELEEELDAARAELERLKATESAASTTSPSASGIAFEGPAGGDFQLGGAVRVNYVLGDYPNTPEGGPSRGGNGGVFELDTFRFNLEYANGPWVGKGEYRFYSGYNMLHTAWLGYQYPDESVIQAGVNRVPFGAGPYGVSQSWFFDQHYYVGLADDMDLGVKYGTAWGDWALDVAYYPRDEGNWRGSSRRSARYSYDVVNESGDGFAERHQVNLRAIRSLEGAGFAMDIGVSLQAGKLDGQQGTADGDHHAASVHAVTEIGNWTLAGQLSYCEYDGARPTITLGAYDFPNQVASRAWVPAISLSRLFETSSLEWLDSARAYLEYSSVVKTRDGFNDRELAILGVAFARGPWYVYFDYAVSNGNEFVGGQAPFGNRLGANPAQMWQDRLNINFGYYY